MKVKPRNRSKLRSYDERDLRFDSRGTAPKKAKAKKREEREDWDDRAFWQRQRKGPLKYRFERMDAGMNAFFSRQLEHIRPGLFEVQYEELKGLELVPMNTSVHIGAEEYTYRWYDQVGKATLMSSLSRRGPRADVHGHEATSKIRSIAASYGYNIQEGRAAMMARLPLEQRKAKAARRAIAEEMDRILLMGDGTSTYYGLYGLFKLSGTGTYVVPDGAALSDTFESKTPEECLFTLHDFMRAMVEETKEVEKPTDLILPLSDYGYLSTTTLGFGTETTILQAFVKNSPYIKSMDKIHSHTLLETAGAASSKRMIAYKPDPDKLEAIVPVEFEQFAPQWDGYEVLTDCHARTGGIVLYYPKSIYYADYGG